jgi:lipid-A-disaccharide synthase
VREILFVAGEASGDSHAAGVAHELTARGAPFALTGIGGDQMRAAGVELIEHTGKLAVMGFVEVLETIPRHWALLQNLKRRLRGGNVALVILVDYPDFNMLVASAAADAGVPVLYYITPQVWAWRRGRLDKLAKTVTQAAVILPFEEKLLRAHGIDATFVGHPLLDRAQALPEKNAARATLGLGERERVLALFPGSRKQEVERHLDDFVSVARELEHRIDGLKVVVALAPHVTIESSKCPYPMVRSASFTVLRAADAAFCKSGTTTLEAAVAGCPLVVAYRMNVLNYAIASRLINVSNISLVNLIAERTVVPEFVQDELQTKAVADTLEPLLDLNSPKRRAMVNELSAVRAALGEPGASGRVAAMAADLAQRGARVG